MFSQESKQTLRWAYWWSFWWSQCFEWWCFLAELGWKRRCQLPKILTKQSLLDVDIGLFLLLQRQQERHCWQVRNQPQVQHWIVLQVPAGLVHFWISWVAKSLSPFKKESCCGVILDPRTGNAPGCACCGGDATWSCWWECCDKDIRRKVVILRHLPFHFRLLPLQTGFHCCIQQNFLATLGPAARSWNIVALSYSSSFASSAKGWAWSRPAVAGVAAIAFYPHSFACHGE